MGKADDMLENVTETLATVADAWSDATDTLTGTISDAWATATDTLTSATDAWTAVSEPSSVAADVASEVVEEVLENLSATNIGFD